MKEVITALSIAALLSGCASSGTSQPTAAQVQADLQIALQVLQETGCITQAASAIAAPIVAVTADAQGNRVLTAVNASGAAVCVAPAPATVASPVGTTLGAVVSK